MPSLGERALAGESVALGDILVISLFLLVVAGSLFTARFGPPCWRCAKRWFQADPGTSWCNRKQKTILWISAGVICLMLAFPPWRSGGTVSRYQGHKWICAPQEYLHIDRDRLSLQLGVVGVLTIVAFVTSGIRRKSSEKS
jgi:hypothetical protein